LITQLTDIIEIQMNRPQRKTVQAKKLKSNQSRVTRISVKSSRDKLVFSQLAQSYL